MNAPDVDVKVGLDHEGLAAKLANVLRRGSGVPMPQVLVLIDVPLSLELFEAHVALCPLHFVVGKVDVLLHRAFVAEELSADLAGKLGDFEVLGLDMVLEPGLNVGSERALRIRAI